MSVIFDELLLILTDFGGGGGDPKDDVVRFLLPSFFWTVLAYIALKQWRVGRERRDLYIGIASLIGLCREMSMLIMQYGGWRGLLPKEKVFYFYPPFEHAFTMMSCLLMAYAFMKYFLPWRRLQYIYFLAGSSLIALLYLVTAPLWVSYLDAHPGTLFGAFWGDMAFRVSASILMGAALGSLILAARKGASIPPALYAAFSFFFLDEFLMIFNLANDEKYVRVYAPIRHNLHIWAIPLFLSVYWTDLFKRLSVMEEQLNQSRKMEAIGRLAGGIAHDFNNLLTVIIGYGGIMRRQLPQDHPMKEHAETIETTGKRAAALTQQLLAFSRRQALRTEPVNIGVVVNEIKNLLKRMLREDILLEFHIAKTSGNIMADRGQLEQVLLNLSINARDAMPNGGRLIIETSEFTIKDKYSYADKEIEPGTYVVLSVSDTGVGMSAEIKEKIFEPFYTTKELGKGTGLGLATVFGIIKQHNGHIHVYSEEGKGTTFRVYLPCTNQAVIKTEPVIQEPQKQRSGTVLVVDDDKMVCKLIADILRPLGWHVIEATDGYEAIGASNEYAGDIDILLTDVVMPNINSKVLAETIEKKRPAIKTVFMSGYTYNVIAHHGVLDEGITFLQKPLKMDELINTLSRTLEVC